VSRHRAAGRLTGLAAAGLDAYVVTGRPDGTGQLVRFDLQRRQQIAYRALSSDDFQVEVDPAGTHVVLVDQTNEWVASLRSDLRPTPAGPQPSAPDPHPADLWYSVVGNGGQRVRSSKLLDYYWPLYEAARTELVKNGAGVVGHEFVLDGREALTVKVKPLPVGWPAHP
jgi:hypothetical protein